MIGVDRFSMPPARSIHRRRDTRGSAEVARTGQSRKFLVYVRTAFYFDTNPELNTLGQNGVDL
jgi:hypothetical protein